MPYDSIIQNLSFVIGIFGIIIAFIQGFERKKLKQFIHSQAWHTFSISNLSFGAAQSALTTYKEKYADKIDTEILEHLSKCDAFNINLFIESIRQIQLSEPKFDFESIATWEMQGRISKTHRGFFIKAMPMKTPNLLILTWSALTLRVRQKLIKYISPHQNKPNTHTDRKPE